MKVFNFLVVISFLFLGIKNAEAKGSITSDCVFKVQMTLPCGAVYEDCYPWTITQEQELWKTWVRYTQAFCPVEEIQPPQ